MKDSPFRYQELGIEVSPSGGPDTTGDRIAFSVGGASYSLENDLRHQPADIETLAATLGIKKSGKIDFTAVRLPSPQPAAAVFTRSLCPSVTILRGRRVLEGGTLQALAVNSGNANVFTPTGETDLERTATLLSAELGVSAEHILICSTGVIGVPLPMEKFEAGIPGVAKSLRPGALEAASEAILTTDLGPKTASFKHGELIICGMAKGAGMIEPDLATMLVFFFTNAALDAPALQSDLESAAGGSFNRISIDSDTSTSDAVALFTTNTVKLDAATREVFRSALTALSVKLARDIVSQGEGVSKIIEAKVSTDLSAAFSADAAKLIINSPLVKAAVHGGDPNWGRIIAAIGKGSADGPLDPATVRVSLMGTTVYDGGKPVNVDLKGLSAAMKSARRIPLEVLVGKPTYTARSWGADLTEAYVRFNSEYTT